MSLRPVETKSENPAIKEHEEQRAQSVRQEDPAEGTQKGDAQITVLTLTDGLRQSHCSFRLRENLLGLAKKQLAGARQSQFFLLRSNRAAPISCSRF